MKDREIFKVKEDKFLVHPPVFYIEENHLESWVDVHKEIARHFSGGNRTCDRELRYRYNQQRLKFTYVALVNGFQPIIFK